jgi:hypothetical protein
MVLLVVATVLTLLQPAQARWYDAETGRWLTRDRTTLADGLNQYQYVRSNPIAHVDPTGLVSLACFTETPPGAARPWPEDIACDFVCDKEPGIFGGTSCGAHLCCVCVGNISRIGGGIGQSAADIIMTCVDAGESYNLSRCGDNISQTCRECGGMTTTLECILYHLPECPTPECTRDVLKFLQAIQSWMLDNCAACRAGRPTLPNTPGPAVPRPRPTPRP